MSDYCFMEVRCLARDKGKFEALGFVVQSIEGDLAVLTDEQANYAHSGKMPLDIPYFGEHSDGGDYGAARFCCDGKRFFENAISREGRLAVSASEQGIVTKASQRKVLSFARKYADVKQALLRFKSAAT